MRITLRLWASMIVLVVAVLALVWMFLIILLPQVYFDDASARLDYEAESVGLILHGEFPDSLSSQARAALNGMSDSSDLRIEFFDMTGRTLFRSGWGDAWSPLAGHEFEFILVGNDLRKSLHLTGYGDVLILGKLIDTVSGAQSVLTVCIQVAPIDNTLDILAQQMIIVIAASLVVSMIMAYYLSRMFVRPIREMDSVAALIAEGEFGEKITFNSNNELGDLAATINKMSEQLGQIEVMRRDFIATVSHQFKTPLAIIQGHVELIADTLPAGTAKQYEAQFSLIIDEISKLDQMARDMLKLSQVQSAELKLERVELDELCADMLGKLAVLDIRRSISLSLENGLAVHADPELLNYVLENLLKNALKHSKASEIILSAQAAPDGRILLYVSDNGIGLTEKQLKHVWDRFYKGDPNSTGNSGLGMAIVKEILLLHKAEYGISSGRGTKVWFYLNRA